MEELASKSLNSQATSADAKEPDFSAWDVIEVRNSF